MTYLEAVTAPLLPLDGFTEVGSGIREDIYMCSKYCS